MNQNDFTIFQQAVHLAQTGQLQQAYDQFVALSRTNLNDANLLLWIAFTSPNLAEARRAIDHATWLDPENPNLHAANVHWMSRQQSAIIASKPKGLPTWVKAVGVAVLIQFVIALATIGVLVALGPQISSTYYATTYKYPTSVKPTADPCSCKYTTYTDPDTMRKTAAIDSYAKISTANLTKMSMSDGYNDFYLWETKPNTTSETGVILKFPRNTYIKPASGKATYYVKVTSRMSSTVSDDAYLYAEVEDVE